jgi:chemotaxis-related protein WspD
MSAPAEYCWREIGVRGDRSCERLAEFVHCRNCPEFARVGRTLLDREVPQGYLWQSTGRLAQPAVAAAEQTVSVVVFRLGEEWFALRALAFEQIAEYHPVHSVPARSGGVLDGLVNVNGELLLAASLPALLALEKPAAPVEAPRRRTVVVRREHERYAFTVDEVLGVRRVSLANSAGVPATVSRAPSAQTSACLRIESRDVGLLDETRLFERLSGGLRW